MMTETFLPKLDAVTLDRYLAGECTNLERTHVDLWLDARPRRRMTVDVLQQTLANTGRTTSIDLDGEWLRLQRGYLHGGYPDSRGVAQGAIPTRPRSPRDRWMRWGVGIAAIAVAAFGSVFAINRVTQLPCGAANCPALPAMTAYTTAPGEHANITLSDGTVVTLNVASRLEVPENFMRNRVVHLTGQAYFQVKHTAGSPFRVNANNTQTIVLGTAFGIQAYGAEPVEVAVRTGKVQFNRVVLSANDVARTTHEGAVILASDPHVDATLAFVNGRLVLEEVALRDAIPQLNRWYGVDIRLGDSTLGDRVIGSASLENGSPGDLMDILRRTFHVHVVRHGRLITLYSR